MELTHMSPAKKQASKPAHENLAALDPVVKLAMELKEVEGRYDFVDLMCGKLEDATSAHTYAESERQHLGRRADALREGVSGLQAQTIAGALVHAMLLEAEMDTLQPAGKSIEQKLAYLKIERLISSIKSVLIASTPEPLIKVLPHLNMHLDRWATFEECLSRVKFCQSSRLENSDSQRDSIFAAIEEHKALIASANERGLSEDEVAIRSDLADVAWWAMIDATPETINGAAELAKYVAEIEESNLCPTVREIDGPTEHGSTIALRRIATFIRTDNEVGASASKQGGVSR
jgi:hypothetical protein